MSSGPTTASRRPSALTAPRRTLGPTFSPAAEGSLLRFQSRDDGPARACVPHLQLAACTKRDHPLPGRADIGAENGPVQRQQPGQCRALAQSRGDARAVIALVLGIFIQT